MAEVAKSRLLEVEDIVLDSMANAVLALDGVAGGLVSLHPGATLWDEAERCRLSQSFELRDGGCSSSDGGVIDLLLRFWIKHTEKHQQVCECVKPESLILTAQIGFYRCTRCEEVSSLT